MSLGTSNRDGGKTSESGHLRAIMKGLKAQVLSGLNVTQRGAGANMSVDVQIGDAVIPRSDGTYGHPAWADAIYNVAITAADGSNPRRDIVVMYIDYNQAPSTDVSNNTNGVVKIAVVAGTPAGSPTDPSNTTIQSAVGSGNPFIKLARVRVGAGVTTISNSVIDDLRLMAQGLLQGGWTYDDLYTWVYGSSTTFTIAGVDATAQFPVGTKIALYQSGSIKYFTVVTATFSTNTTVTVDGADTYTLANVPIDRPAFSYMRGPVGFPVNESNIPFYNPYKFNAYRSTNVAGLTAGQIIPFNATNFDTNSNFNTSTNRYVAPVSGYYWFHSSLRFSFASSAQYNQLNFMKNGVSVSRGGFSYYGSASGSFNAEGGCFLFLNAGDYVQVQYQGKTGELNGVASGINNSFMEGFLVSRT